TPHFGQHRRLTCRRVDADGGSVAIAVLRRAEEEDELERLPPGLIGLELQADDEPAAQQPRLHTIGVDEERLRCGSPDDAAGGGVEAGQALSNTREDVRR